MEVVIVHVVVVVESGSRSGSSDEGETRFGAFFAFVEGRGNDGGVSFGGRERETSVGSKEKEEGGMSSASKER